MRVAQLAIRNFRGVCESALLFPPHTVLVGDNNVGKSTVLEALDLVLGPDRLARRPVIDEHDFYAGTYLMKPEGEGSPETIAILIEAIVADLSEKQRTKFHSNIEWWDNAKNELVAQTMGEGIEPALRIFFLGRYDPDEDDFEGKTYFSTPQLEDGKHTEFGSRDKRECGFLYLRALRTGTRALSMERGSLLDIILRLKDIRPNMWENVLEKLRGLPVAEDPALGLTDILTNIQKAIRRYVPAEWGVDPHLRVSDLTREHLRRTLTSFLATGAGKHSAPFQHQGTGTINMLVLALLSMIAEEKQSVIFAMEEPEVAIPPYTQKRIVDQLRTMASQAIFTSHSPFVLEEFEPSGILILKRDAKGHLSGAPVVLPEQIKFKKYRQDFRSRFSEALLARRVLITEGMTELTAIPAAARRLSELDPQSYSSLEHLGVALFDAEADSQVGAWGGFFRGLGKQTFAAYDKQAADAHAVIAANVDHPFMSPYSGFEELVVSEVPLSVQGSFIEALMKGGRWPSHLTTKHPDPLASEKATREALFDYLCWGKGAWGAADLLAECTVDQMPKIVKEMLVAIRAAIEPKPDNSETADAKADNNKPKA